MPNTFVIGLSISFLVVAWIFSSSIINVFAVPPDNRWVSSQNCSTNKDGTITCCWREPIEGSILGQKYCQACDSDPNKSDKHTCKPKQPAFTAPDQSLPQDNLLESTTPPLSQSTPPKGGLLGLLNEESNTLQPLVPETQLQRDNTDSLSNFYDGMLTNDYNTNLPNQDELSSLTGEENVNELPATETDNKDNGNIPDDNTNNNNFPTLTEEEQKEEQESSEVKDTEVNILKNDNEEIEKEDKQETKEYEDTDDIQSFPQLEIQEDLAE